MGPPLQLLSRVQNATSRTPAIQRTECQAHCNHATHPRDLRRSIRRRLTGRCAVPVTPPESCSNFQLRTPVPPRAILCLISSSMEMSREVPRKPVKSGCGSLLLGRMPHLRETSSRIFSRLLSIVFRNSASKQEVLEPFPVVQHQARIVLSLDQDCLEHLLPYLFIGVAIQQDVQLVLDRTAHADFANALLQWLFLPPSCLYAEAMSAAPHFSVNFLRESSGSAR